MLFIEGILIGIISSLVAWYILFHIIKPFIIFEKLIIVPYKDNENGEYCSVVIRNAGFTKSIDLEIIIRVIIPELNYIDKEIKTNIDMHLSMSKLVRLSPNNYRRVSFNIPYKIFEQLKFSKDIQLKSLKKSLSLKDILLINEEAKLIVYVFASDSLSGARTLSISKEYKLKDITQNEIILSATKFQKLTRNKKDIFLRLSRKYKFINES